MRQVMYLFVFTIVSCHIHVSFFLYHRWRFVVHAGVDGYSRLPVFVRCSDNNRADTVLHAFIEAVQTYGLPSRVRCDIGTENYDFAYYMFSHPSRGPGRGSIIAGKSVHNQIVERFWRDLFQGCLSVYYHLFHHMEHTGILNPLNAIHLFALHHVFLPRINQSINVFCETWNRHRIRTAGNSSPLQLWIRGHHEVDNTYLDQVANLRNLIVVIIIDFYCL